MKETLCRDTVQTPVGKLVLIADDRVVRRILFPGEKNNLAAGNKIIAAKNQPLKALVRDLKNYFSGRNEGFGKTTIPEGSEFQMKVWRQIAKIPYGKTVSYKELAGMIGKPKAVRAIGTACGRNPTPLVIPCHRVIASDGGLGGYGGGLKIKKYLLQMEKK